MALRKSSMREFPAPAIGSALEGELVIHGERTPVRLKVVRENASVVGCRFESASDQMVVLVRRHFRVEQAAAEMIRINPKYLKQPATGKFSCYRSLSGAELRVNEDASGVVSDFVLVLFGWHLEAARGKSLEIGRVVEEESTDEIRYKGSALIEKASGRNTGLLKAAVRLLELTKVLEPAHRDFALAAIRRLLTDAEPGV